MTPQDGPSLASLLTTYMDERGLTQGQLAARAGIAPATLSRWLNRKWTRPYHREGVLSLAVALGLPRVSTNRLLRAAGLPPIDALARSPSGTERALLERWVRPVRNNLPADLTSFVGRDAEVTALAELLLRDDVRLVTLTGTGGSGKTRLALRVAEEGLDAFPDGVYFVPLVPVTDPALLLPSIAEAVGLREVLASTILGQLASWLQRKQVLLLLDNLEQLLDGAPVIAELLRAAPGLRVLATSRVPLHLSGEHEWPVDPFPVPDPGGPRRLLRASEAVELFRQRARAANARRALDDDEELAAMAELCARLDGLPLAIELAAARTRDRSPERLLAEFPARLDLGSAGPRDVPPRQRTLRAAIDWSLTLLPAPARVVLTRLSVFAGGWTEEAAVAVCAGAGVPAGEVPGWLSTLADASLVVRVGSTLGGRRYRMLETIREYGAELLARKGETTTLRERHARFFQSLAESAPPYVPEVREGNWYVRVEEDLDNVRAALAWSAEQDDPEMLARLCAALWPYWHEFFRVGEGRRWLDLAISRGSTLSPRIRAGVLTGAVTLGFTQTDYQAAIGYGTEALGLWRELDDHRGRALVLQQLGWSGMAGGNLAAGFDALMAMLEAWRAVNDLRGVACALCDLGLAATVIGDLAAGAAYLAEAEESYHAAGDTEAPGRLRREQGLLALLSGDNTRAISLLREAVERLTAAGRTYLLLMTLFFLGTAYYQSGELDEAIACYADSLRLHDEIGDQGGVGLTLLGFAAVAHRQGDPSRSAVLCGAVQSLHQTHRVVLQPAVQAIYEREVAMVVEQIGSERFATAFAHGAELTTAEALAYAREGIREP